jgi:hypothetical protein
MTPLETFLALLTVAFCALWIRSEFERTSSNSELNELIDFLESELEKWKPGRNPDNGRFI